MKKAKPRPRSAKHNMGRVPANAAVKSKKRSAATSGSSASAAIAPASLEPLAEAIGALAAIVADLRQITDDLRDTIRSGQEPDIDAVVVTEVEGSEAREERGEGQEDFGEGFRDDFEEDS
ncbi:MAG TPA: hypothetical protein VKT99_05095 [Xanthobacteraceae bacterium]|nr:hypothetical protein [Xanthobacteraceae bacterium]